MILKSLQSRRQEDGQHPAAECLLLFWLVADKAGGKEDLRKLWDTSCPAEREVEVRLLFQTPYDIRYNTQPFIKMAVLPEVTSPMPALLGQDKSLSEL